MFELLDQPSAPSPKRPLDRFIDTCKITVFGAAILAMDLAFFGAVAYLSGKYALKFLTHTPMDGLDLIGGGVLGLISVGTGLKTAGCTLRTLAALPKYLESISDAVHGMN